MENLAILDGRGRNRMRREKSMDLRPTARLGSMVVATKGMEGGLLRCNA